MEIKLLLMLTLSGFLAFVSLFLTCSWYYHSRKYRKKLIHIYATSHDILDITNRCIIYAFAKKIDRDAVSNSRKITYEKVLNARLNGMTLYDVYPKDLHPIITDTLKCRSL